MIWFTSDTHFGHANIIKYCKRPFKDVEEMNKTLIINWNSVVRPNDTVYHLGDFAFDDPRKYIETLWGDILFVSGNHDKQLLNFYRNIPQIRKIKIEDKTVTLCHFAMRVWHQSHFNMPHLYGHSHNGLSEFGQSFDIGVDAWNYFPVSWEQVKAKLKTLPDNLNWLEKLKGFDQKELDAFKARGNLDEDDVPPESNLTQTTSKHRN